MHRRFPVLVILALLASCAPPEPLRLGYIGGLSGTNTDLGIGGRDGVELAVEQVNALGGIRGRPVELLVADDAYDPRQGVIAFQSLADQGVTAIVGPMTSLVATAIVPLADERRLLLMAGPVTTEDLSGRDDYFFRVIGSSRHHASVMAAFLRGRYTRLSIIFDLRNRAYTQSWVNSFLASYLDQDHRVLTLEDYESGPGVSFPLLAARALAPGPDLVILVTGSVDAAILATKLRQQAPDIALATSEWAGTSRLIELGGAGVEGAYVPQYLDLLDGTSAYRSFVQAFRARYGRDPGFPAAAGYNATRVLIQALGGQEAGEDLRDTVLRLRHFEGLQEPIVFDPWGDTLSSTHIARIRKGAYVLP